MRKVILPLFLLSAVPCHFALASDTDSSAVYDQQSQGQASGQAGTYDQSQAGTYDQSQAGTYDQSQAQPQGQPGTAEATTPGVTTAEAAPMEPGGLFGEKVGLKPQVGMINYKDAFARTNNRGTVGLQLDMNATGFLSRMGGGEGAKGSPLFIGPSTGAFFSHTGVSGAAFFGNSSSSSATGAGTPGANLFWFPLNLKIGYAFGPFRPSIRGGGNLFYRSVANAVGIGTTPDPTQDSSWKTMWNAGLDLEYGVTNKIALIARPDVTFGGSNAIWSASIGAALPLG